VVQAAIDAQHIAEVVADPVGVKVADTQMRLISELVHTRTHPAGLQWESITSSTFEASEYAGVPEAATGMLSAWLEDSRRDEAHFRMSEEDTTDMRLYRCWRCVNPSVVLRKCAGCGTARYESSALVSLEEWAVLT
jgi:hypothetical protein